MTPALQIELPLIEWWDVFRPELNFATIQRVDQRQKRERGGEGRGRRRRWEGGVGLSYLDVDKVNLCRVICVDVCISDKELLF